MNFLADVWITCDVCKGKRYDSETLLVDYRGKTIADVLEMEVEEALEFFTNHKRIARVLTDPRRCRPRLPQARSAERTRCPAARRSASSSRRSCRGARRCPVLYVLDEPTTGLHFDDVAKLAAVLHRLVDAGHAVVCHRAQSRRDRGQRRPRHRHRPRGRRRGRRRSSRRARRRRSPSIPESHTGRFLAAHMKRRRGVKSQRIEALPRIMEEGARDGLPA